MRPATAIQAADHLGRAPATIRQWAFRYRARTFGRAGRQVVYDLDDLATIEGCIWRGDPVPLNPEDRDRLRTDLGRIAGIGKADKGITYELGVSQNAV